ncbi:MAG: adenosine-specific kinase [Caldisericaceae bacterium]
MNLEIKVVSIEKPEDMNCILGQSHFIKTVEDLSEVIAGSVPGAKFGLAFNEASGVALIRFAGNDPELIELAKKNANEVGAGHFFIIFLQGAFPINVLNAIKSVQEVCSIYAASANPMQVIVAETNLGRAVLGVVDGLKPKGFESAEDTKERKDLLRKFGYKS